MSQTRRAAGETAGGASTSVVSGTSSEATSVRPWWDLCDWQADPLLSYAKGLEDGVQLGRELADAALARVIAEALGGTGCVDRAEAVRRHLRAVDARRHRAEADRPGPRPTDFPGRAA